MCRADIFTYCAGIIQMANEGYRIPKGKAAIQLIVIGDFCQLPPVFLDKDKVILKELKEGYAFESSRWKEFHFKYLELKDNIRQEDAAFVDNLNKVREGSYAGVTWINEHASKKRQPGIYICSTNKKAAELNEKGLSGLSTKKKTYYAKEYGQIAV